MANEPEIPRVIAAEVVYVELYNEMRRFRDYELQASNWYTLMLLAITGFVLDARFGADKGAGTRALLDSCPVTIFLAIATLLIAGSSLYSIWYIRKRYMKIRDYVTAELEPEWKKEADVKDEIALQPHHCVSLVQLVLASAVLLAILIPG